jgi:hypothetical protein
VFVIGLLRRLYRLARALDDLLEERSEDRRVKVVQTLLQSVAIDDGKCGGCSECLYRGNALTLCLFVPPVVRNKLGTQRIGLSLYEQGGAPGRKKEAWLFNADVRPSRTFMSASGVPSSPHTKSQLYYEPGVQGCVKSATLPVLGSVASSKLQAVK